MFRVARYSALLLLASVACRGSSRRATVSSVAQGEVASTDQRTPNEMGRIPILEDHLLGDSDSRWHVERNHFRRDLERLYASGYRPVTVAEMIDKKIDLPAGQSPVVFTFDDAGPSQFSYVDHDGTLEIDPNSGMGIWLAFRKKHPDWDNRAVPCLVIEYRKGKEITARTWVRKSDGLVLQQEASNLGFEMILQRKPN